MASNAMNKKKSFIFYVEWQEILMDYPEDVRLEVYDAIIEYVASGTLLDMKPMAKMAFSFIKKEIDYNTEKYEEIVEKRKAASKKAVEKRCQQGTNNKSNDTKSITCNHMVSNGTICDQMASNGTYHDNDIIYNDNIKETTTKVVAKKSAAKAATLSRKEKFYESLVPYLSEYPKDMIRKFFDYWSEMNKSCTKMKWEQEKTWELNLRLANWANREKDYSHGNNRNTTKQEANEYAMQKLAERIEQRKQGVSDEVSNPW